MAERLGLRLKIGENVEVTNINDDPRFNEYWQYYHGLTGRRGVTVAAAKNLMRSRPTLIAAVMVARGEADAMLTGIVGRFHKKLGYVRSVLPLEPKVTSTSAMTGASLNRGTTSHVASATPGGSGTVLVTCGPSAKGCRGRSVR